MGLLITEAILAVVFLPLSWLFDAVPVVTWPAWFQTSGTGTVVDKVGEWGEHIGLLASWVPVVEFFNALEIVAVCSAAALAIRVARVLGSLFTGGGGAV